MSECLYPEMRHQAVWCPACWADERESRSVRATERLADTIHEFNTRIRDDEDSVSAPPKRRPPTTPLPPKPQDGGYKWRP
jgi:hypothetical protein